MPQETLTLETLKKDTLPRGAQLTREGASAEKKRLDDILGSEKPKAAKSSQRKWR
jgi:hypothetical protein